MTTHVAPPGEGDAAAGRRLAGTLVSFLTYAGLLLLGVLVGALFLDTSPTDATTLGLLVGVMAWDLLALAILLTRAASPGQLALGLVTVDAVTGAPAPGKALAKAILMGVASSLTCGIALVVGLLVTTPGTNQHLFDRITGVRVARRGVLAAGAGAAAAPPSTPPVTQVPVPPTSPTPMLAPSTAFLSGAPVSAPAVPAVPPPAVTVVPPPPVTDATVVEAPGPASASLPSTPGLRLELDQGGSIPVDRTWVIGRDPVAPGTHPGATPFSVPDDTRSLSKTHLAVAPAATGAEVTDLHSTNGVTLERPGRSPLLLIPGVPTPLQPGDTLLIGRRRIEAHR